jgi:hypothetical protein
MVFNASCAIHKGILNDLNDASHVDQRCIKPHFSQLSERLICHKQLRRIVNTPDLGTGHPHSSGSNAATFLHLGKNQPTRLWISKNQVDLAVGTAPALSQQIAATISIEVCNAMLCGQSRMKGKRTAHSCLPMVNAI